ncbi:olfactory marker protein [Rousettus aegyptiacus]|nr:olfactory marker protein [Rousettus aegyptiacus]
MEVVVRVVATAIDISGLVPEEPVTLLPACSASISASAKSGEEAFGDFHPHTHPTLRTGWGWKGPVAKRCQGRRGPSSVASCLGCEAPAHSAPRRPQRQQQQLAMAEDGPKQPQLTMPLVLDEDLTKQMRLRVESLKQRGEKRQDGEKLLRPAESVYRLDFVQQQRLQFERWDVVLDKPGKVTITGTSQNWTPDLTNLMTRQLLDPAAIFWRKEDSDAMDWNEADALEFGERLSELAKIRKVMYFLITFGEGVEPANLKASVVFNQL